MNYQQISTALDAIRALTKTLPTDPKLYRRLSKPERESVENILSEIDNNMGSVVRAADSRFDPKPPKPSELERLAKLGKKP